MSSIDSGVFYDAVPRAGRAAIQRAQLDATLHAQLVDLIDATSPVLPAAAARAAAALATISLPVRLAPVAFALQWKLVAAISSVDVGAVATALGRLALEIEGGTLNARPLAVETLTWDLVDEAVVDYVMGEDGRSTPRDDPAEMVALPPDALSGATREFSVACRALAQLDPELADERDAYIAAVRLFAGRAIVGVTSMRSFGCVHLRVPSSPDEIDDPTLYYLEHLAHETSHLHLHALMNLDPLILNGDLPGFDAPIRQDPRPLFGVFHATFVLGRIARVLERYAQSVPSPAARAAHDLSVQRFEQGFATISRHAELTAAGSEVMQTSRKNVLAR
jgi:HEXXH motif-containing protein